jgi:hypothetical protein
MFGEPLRAADTTGRAPPQTLLCPAIPFDWTGPYFGGHVGYSRGYGRNALFDPDLTAAGRSFGSLFGGLQFGYNYLLPSRLLVGIEGDISFPNFLDDGNVASRSTQTSSVTEKLDFVSTLRGRIGYAFDHWLFYATGGPAWSQARFIEQAGLTGAGPPESSISTTIWEKPAARSRRVPAMNRRRLIFIVFGLHSTGNSTGQLRRQTPMTSLLRGRSTGAAGMSMGNLPTSSRAILLSARPIKARTACRAQARSRIRQAQPRLPAFVRGTALNSTSTRNLCRALVSATRWG